MRNLNDVVLIISPVFTALECVHTVLDGRDVWRVAVPVVRRVVRIIARGRRAVDVVASRVPVSGDNYDI